MSSPATDTVRIPMSWDEYVDYDLGDRRAEYIDGALVMEAPNRIHQDMALQLAITLQDAVGDRARVTFAWGWKPGDDEFVPDILVYPPTDEVQRLTAMPHLAVEVLSTEPARDTVIKLAKYAAVGLRRYWIVDPERPELVAYELAGAEFREVGRFGPADEADLDVGSARVRFRPADLLA